MHNDISTSGGLFFVGGARPVHRNCEPSARCTVHAARSFFGGHDPFADFFEDDFGGMGGLGRSSSIGSLHRMMSERPLTRAPYQAYSVPGV
jgi:hypothetical protein